MKINTRSLHLRQNQEFPWYDSRWLSKYRHAQELIKAICPERLPDFKQTLAVFTTQDSFVATKLQEPVLDAGKLEKSRQIIKQMKSEQLEKHEFLSMGRQVVHNHEYFNKLQEKFCDLVSNIVNEPVEPQYNFLSLYNNLGVCEPHMDAPQAKWTLDVCIEQSAPWPIHFSQVRPWPKLGQYKEEDWQQQILNDPEITFTPQILYPGEGLVFSGGNQWHYRERIINIQKNNYCHLIFFHYIPKGTRELVNPENWADIFNIPELNSTWRLTH